MTIRDRVKQEFRSAAEEAFAGLLVAAAHVEQQLDAACAEHGLTHAQYNVLRILRGAQPEGHPRFEIAERLMARAPDVTRLLDRLERRGLIERGWAPHNRRQSIARITTAGLDLLRQIDPKVRRIREAALSGVPAAQLPALVRAFNAIVASRA